VNPPLGASDAEIRTLAQEILARPEYARWRAEPPAWVFSWLRKLAGALHDILAWTTDLWRTRPLLYAVLVTTLLVVSMLLLAHVFLALRRAFQATAPDEPSPKDSTAPDFVGEAEALARRGSFLEAAHRIQLAAIALLLKRRVIELSRSDPNRTLRRRLREASLASAERRDLLNLLDRFETCWFRDRAEDRDLYEEWRGLFERLREDREPA
jgi:hypothetical protein